MCGAFDKLIAFCVLMDVRACNWGAARRRIGHSFVIAQVAHDLCKGILDLVDI